MRGVKVAEAVARLKVVAVVSPVQLVLKVVCSKDGLVILLVVPSSMNTPSWEA